MNRIIKSFLLFILLSLFICHGYSQVAHWNIQQCIDTAMKNNLQIRQSYLNIETGKINYSQSKLNLLPDFNASATQNFNSGRSLNTSNYQFTTSAIRSNNFSLTGSVPLFNGFQNLNKIHQNEANYKAYYFDYEDMRNNTTISVINAYLAVLYAYEAVKNADSQVVATQAQVNLTDAMVIAGKKAGTELLTIKSQFATDKFNLVDSKSTWKTALVNLQQLMNIPVSSNFDIDYTIVATPSPITSQNAGEIFQTSVTFMPSVKAAEMRTMSQEFSLKIVRGALLPKLSLSGSLSTSFSSASQQNSYSTQTATVPIGYLQSNPSEIVLGKQTTTTITTTNYPYFDQLNDNFNKGLFFTLSIPIFNNFLAMNNVALQKINLQNSRLSEEQTKVTLRKNIEQAFLDYENSTEKYNAANEQMYAANISYLASKDKYDNGLMNAADLLLEKNKLIQAQSNLLQAKYDLIFRTKILDYYNGKTINL